MKYSAKEIIDMAVELEKTGSYFYSKCSEKFEKDSELKGLFHFLADEELEHQKIFTSMLNDLKDSAGNFTDEYYEYLSALISGRIFRNIEAVAEFINEIEDVIDAFHAAIQAEKDSVLFYSEIKSMYEANAGAQIILDKLINAERSHLVKLNDMLKLHI